MNMPEQGNSALAVRYSLYDPNDSVSILLASAHVHAGTIEWKHPIHVLNCYCLMKWPEGIVLS